MGVSEYVMYVNRHTYIHLGLNTTIVSINITRIAYLYVDTSENVPYQKIQEHIA